MNDLISPRWHKILRDLWGAKTRTILVVLSIAIGIFAIGMMLGTQNALAQDFAAALTAANPDNATVSADSFDDEMVQTIRAMRGVRDAEGRRSINVRVRTGPDEWKNLQIIAISDFDDIRVNKIFSESGAWPPRKREILAERGSLELLGVPVGGTITVETTENKRRDLRVVGLAYDIDQQRSSLTGQGVAYATLDTLEMLGAESSYNELAFVVAGDVLSKSGIQDVAKAIRDKLEKNGSIVYSTYVSDPGTNRVENNIQVFTLILGSLGALCLILSGFLVINTISALLTQQARQIGIMKAIGARRYQVITLYLGMVLAFGVLALMIGVPLGVFGAWGITSLVATMENFNPPSPTLSVQVVVVEIAIGLFVPVVAGLYPAIAGTRVSAREAMSDYGMGKALSSNSAFDRLMRNLRGFSRPVLLSLRNTFRHKVRLALTLVTLSLSAAIFIGVFSLKDSLVLTLNEALSSYTFDVEIDFNQPYSTEFLQREALAVPGVLKAEPMIGTTARRMQPDGNEGNQTSIIGLVPDTAMIAPVLQEGRWLIAGDENAIVVNSEFTRREPDIQVGDEIVLKIDGRKTTWHVVGIVHSVATGSMMYASTDYLARTIRSVNQASSIWALTERHDRVSEMNYAKALEERYKAMGLRVSNRGTVAEARDGIVNAFNIIVMFLLVLSLPLAVVGALGLMGTMSLNVLERRREIGVMRAIGASNRAVRRVFLVESMLIGVLSWLLGALLSIPLGWFLSVGIGSVMRNAAMPLTFSLQGLGIWLVVVLVLSALASALPARSASRISVQEVLAYE